MKIFEMLTILIVVLAVMFLIIWTFHENQMCRDRGGMIVRSVFGYECVDREVLK